MRMRIKFNRSLTVEHGDSSGLTISTAFYDLGAREKRTGRCGDWPGLILAGAAALGGWMALGPKALCGLVGIISAAGINNLAAAFAGISVTPIESYRWHAAGAGTAPESAADVDLELPLPVARGQGTQQVEAGISYLTTGVVMFADTYTVTEWGLFPSASGGPLWDRAVIDPVPVVSGHWVRFTYRLTFERA